MILYADGAELQNQSKVLNHGTWRWKIEAGWKYLEVVPGDVLMLYKDITMIYPA